MNASSMAHEGSAARAVVAVEASLVASLVAGDNLQEAHVVVAVMAVIVALDAVLHRAFGAFDAIVVALVEAVAAAVVAAFLDKAHLRAHVGATVIGATVIGAHVGAHVVVTVIGAHVVVTVIRASVMNASSMAHEGSAARAVVAVEASLVASL